MELNKDFIRVLPEIEKALQIGLPVVALESSIIAQGLPYPLNIQTALDVESEVKDFGAIPATIAVLDGKICIGLTENEINWLGANNKKEVMKLSSRDIPYAIAKKIPGATTVAATMVCAEKVGIQVFATGGIGGVHRGWESSLDISADLQELSRTRVAVVCAGAKSILDIGSTLEVLETYGVPVIGYRTNHFPAFYCERSGYELDCSAQTPEEIAQMLKIQWRFKQLGAAIVAQPPPKESAIDYDEIETLISKGLLEADTNKIHGKAVTPFLLKQLAEQTKGKSVEVNIALVKNNARLAAQIAYSLLSPSF